MDIFLIIIICAAAIALVMFAVAYVCFYRIFYVPKKDKEEYKNTEFPIPKGDIYEVHSEDMIKWMKMLKTTPHENWEIRSFDGLTLRATYYEYAPGAPVELLFHGYRGSAKRDLNGGLARCFALGRSAVLIDHRASGESEGSIITFGVNESRDALDWINYAVKHLGKDIKIIVTGISMGAATAMMVTAKDLPENVVGVLADCGYTSAKDIIKKVIRDMKLPADILYPFVKIGAKIYGKFDIDETPPIEAMKKCKIPVIFIHGESDDFVPCDMSRQNYEACASRKKLVTIPDAGHGVCYPVNKEAYLAALREFFAYVK